jgi:hypothetical protein
MIKNIFLGVCAFTVLCFVGLTSQAEARHHHHCRKSTNIQLNVGAGYSAPYVSRYARPVVLPVYAPVTYYPVAAYPAPVIVEEVYVAPAPRPFLGFGGLSFSWNFFK